MRPYHAVRAKLAPVEQSSEYVGVIKSRRSTTIQPQVEGIVRRIFVRSGDRVRAGQPLVQIDPEKQQASVTTCTTVRRSSRRHSTASSHGERSGRVSSFAMGGALATLRTVSTSDVGVVPDGVGLVEAAASLRPGTPDNLPLNGPSPVEGLLWAQVPARRNRRLPRAANR